jgi:hypothetical protein
MHLELDAGKCQSRLQYMNLEEETCGTEYSVRWGYGPNIAYICP